MAKYNEAAIKKELLIDAKALDIPEGSAELFIKRAVNTATKKLANRSIITENDLRLAIAEELQKYHKDFAYVYKNRDKII